MVRRAFLSVVLAAWCFPGVASAQIALPPSFVDETLITGLDQPNAMAFLRDGRLLFTELETGKIRMVVAGHLASTDPCVVVDSVSTDNIERGLQGIAVDPRWPTFPYVYVCYTHIGNRMSLVRYTATGDVTLANGGNLVLGSKRILIHNFYDNADNHNGLGLRFATDGKLLMTTGDDADGCTAQVTGSLRGKLLRLDVSQVPAGGGGPVPRALLIPPSGNPFVGPDSNACLVYAQGLRNPWRFAVDSQTGDILLGDVGEDTYEELDQIVSGANYGWPYREGPMTRTYPGCTDQGLTYQSPILSLDRNTGYTAVVAGPIYRPPTGGISNWPSLYNGSFFYGDYFNSRLRRMVKSGSNWIVATAVAGQPNSVDWATGMKFATDFAVGTTDGSLYWLKAFNDAGAAQTGMLKRIRYSGIVGVPDIALSERALSASPNPFRDHVDFEWRRATTGRAVIEVFDTVGRRVRRFDAELSEGRVRWDGTDEKGSRVPAGLYFSRLTDDRGSQSVRILHLR